MGSELVGRIRTSLCPEKPSLLHAKLEVYDLWLPVGLWTTTKSSARNRQT